MGAMGDLVVANKKTQDNVNASVFSNFGRVVDVWNLAHKLNSDAKETNNGCNGWWQRWQREQLPELINKIKTSQ